MRALLLCALLLLALVMVVGQADRMEVDQLSGRELENAFLTLSGNAAFAHLNNFMTLFRQNVPHLNNLNPLVVNGLPSLDAIRQFILHPTLDAQRIPPLFPVEHLLTRLATLPADVDKPLFLRILECLPYDWPKNIHPLQDSDAPMSGTRLFVQVERFLVEDLLFPGTIYDVYDVFAQCIRPAIEASSTRLGLPRGRAVSARLIEVAKIIGEMWYLSVLQTGLHFDQLIVSGTLASRFSGIPLKNGVDLVTENLYSTLHHLVSFLDYHPSVLMNTSFPGLRSLILFRIATFYYILKNGLILLRNIYEHFAFLLDLGFEEFVEVEVIVLQQAGVVLTDIASYRRMLETVSRMVKAFVRRKGTGTRGGFSAGFDPTAVSCRRWSKRKALYRSRNPGKHDSNLDVFNWCAQQGIESLRCLLADYYEDIDIAEMTDDEVQELFEEKKGYLFEKVEEREGGEQSRDKKRRLPIDVQRPARPANLPFPPKLTSVTNQLKSTINKMCGSGSSMSTRPRDTQGQWGVSLPKIQGERLYLSIADGHPSLQRDKKIVFFLRGPVPHLVLRTLDGVDITPLLSSSTYYNAQRFIVLVWRSMDHIPQLAAQQWNWRSFLESFTDAPGVSGFLADERDQAWTVAGCRGTPKEYLLGSFALRPSSGQHSLYAGNHQVFVPPERLQPYPQLLALLESATVPVALQLNYPHLVFAYGEEEPIGPLEGILVDGVDGGYQQMAAVLQAKRTERTKEP